MPLDDPFTDAELIRLFQADGVEMERDPAWRSPRTIEYAPAPLPPQRADRVRWRQPPGRTIDATPDRPSGRGPNGMPGSPAPAAIRQLAARFGRVPFWRLLLFVTAWAFFGPLLFGVGCLLLGWAADATAAQFVPLALTVGTIELALVGCTAHNLLRHAP